MAHLSGGFLSFWSQGKGWESWGILSCGLANQTPERVFKAGSCELILILFVQREGTSGKNTTAHRKHVWELHRLGLYEWTVHSNLNFSSYQRQRESQKSVVPLREIRAWSQFHCANVLPGAWHFTLIRFGAPCRWCHYEAGNVKVNNSPHIANFLSFSEHFLSTCNKIKTFRRSSMFGIYFTANAVLNYHQQSWCRRLANQFWSHLSNFLSWTLCCFLMTSMSWKELAQMATLENPVRKTFWMAGWDGEAHGRNYAKLTWPENNTKESCGFLVKGYGSLVVRENRFYLWKIKSCDKCETK